MKLLKVTGLLMCGASMLTMMPATAFAQNAEDENVSETDIVVTATKRPENIQDVPMSVSAVSGDALEQRGINNISQLQGYVPSLRFVTSNTARNSGVFMRGIGQNGTNQGIEPSVGVFLDGVYLPIPGPLQGNLRDISTVEVLRGPQGTLYGRNTPVGAVNINTRAPSQKVEASVTASYGNYDDKQLSGYFGGGLGENLAGRVSFWFSDRDGYELNLATGKDINSSKQWGVRTRLKWDPTSNVRVNLIGYYTKMDFRCCSPEQLDLPALATPGFIAGSNALGTPLLNLVTGDHKVEEFESGRTAMQIAGGSATVDIDLGGAGTLTSITAYSWIRDDAPNAAFAGLQRKTLTRSGSDLTRKLWTQELRLASPTDQPINYLLGVYYLNEKVDYSTELELGPGADRFFLFGARLGDGYSSSYRQKTDSFAGFGQLRFNLSDSIHLIGGLRYTSDKKNADSIVVNLPGTSNTFKALIQGPSSRPGLKRSEDRFTYSVTAQVDLAPHVMAYATYGTGSKSGGFNGGPVGQTVPIEFNEETSSTAEIGIKSSFMNGRIVLNFDVYQMDIKGIQSATVNPGGSGFIVGNSGDRRSKGIELELTVRPSDNLTLRGSFAYLEAKYTSYPAGQCPVVNPGIPAGPRPGSCNFTGLRPYQSPPITASLSFDYRQPLGGNGMTGFVSGDVAFTDTVYLAETLDPRSKQAGFANLGGRIGIEGPDGQWRVAVFGKNLTDHVYYTATTNLILNAVMSAGGASAPGGYVGWYAPPRTYGVEATFKF